MIGYTYSSYLATIMLLQRSIFEKFRTITKMSYFKQNVNPSKRVGMDAVFPWAGRDAPRNFLWASPSGNPSEQPCQPSENPVHPSSFTWINPVLARPGIICAPSEMWRAGCQAIDLVIQVNTNKQTLARRLLDACQTPSSPVNKRFGCQGQG